VTLRNTIVANSTSGGNCSYAIINGGNNIDSAATCGWGSTSGSMSNTNPLLGALTGSPAYFPLNAGSPAIDAGNDAICAAAPVNNESQNGLTRPQGVHCDIGSYERHVTLTLKSTAAPDGWILESGENSNVGGTLSATATTFNLGDNAARKQYRGILHFNTSSLPNNAVITKATLKIKKQGLVGTDPFTTHGNILVDVRKGAFGGSNALQLTDFQAAASKNAAGTIKNTPSSGWYSLTFNSSAFTFINLTGVTQFRLRFAIDDNNDNGADYLKFYSGNYSIISLHPLLVIEYYVP